MKYIILTTILLLVGCKAAMKGGDKSYFDPNHTPFQNAPANFLTTSQNATYDGLTLTWAASSGADRYIIRYKLHNAATYTELATTTASPYHVTGLQTNTMYDFVVVAVNQMGEKTSNVMTVSTLVSLSSPVAQTLSVSSFDENVESIINLPYTHSNNELATSCEIADMVNVWVSTPCHCDGAGVCSVGVTSTPQSWGLSSFKYRVLINAMPSAFETISFNINPINDAPSILALDPVATNEDALTTVNFTIHDGDSPLLCNSTFLSASSTNTSLVPVSAITFSGTYPNCKANFTPVADQSGTTDLQIMVTDGALTASSNVFTVTVNAVNDAPVVSAISTIAVDENASKVVNFTVTDVDSSFTTCAASSSITSSNVTLVDASSVVFSGSVPNCSFTISPLTNQFGQAQITLNVTDGIVTTSTNFTINVAQVNSKPTISFLTSPTVAEGSVGAVSFTIGDVDSVLACTASHLSATSTNPLLLLSSDITFSGNYPNCIATVRPLANKHGTTNITIRVTDGDLYEDSNILALNVSAVNDAPVISSVLTPQVMNQNTVKTVNFTILDIDSPVLCASDVSVISSNTALVPHNNVVITGVEPDCIATITPVNGQHGSTDISLTIHDGQLATTSSFSLVVNAVNAAPTITGLTNFSTQEDAPGEITFTVNDPDSVLSCTASHLSATSSNPLLVLDTDIVFSGTYPLCKATISPLANKYGSTNIVFSVTDGLLTFNAGLVTMSVVAENDAPIISTILTPQMMDQNTVKVVNFTIYDVDGGLLCSNVTGSSTDTSIVPNANIVVTGTYPDCSATITPLTNKNGPVTVSLTVSDGVESNSNSFSLIVTPVNQAPTIITPAIFTTPEDVVAEIDFTINDSDSTLTCSAAHLSAASSNTMLVLDLDVVFTGTYPNCKAFVSPLANQSGIANITITVTDGALSKTSTPIVLTVNAVNDAPTISLIAGQLMDQDTIKVVNFTINDVDPGANLTCSGSVTGSSSNTGIVLNSGVVVTGTYPNCIATITPVARKNGTLNISLVVSDTALTNTSSFSLDIAAVNIKPTISNIVVPAMVEDTPAVVTFTIDDPDSTLECTASYLVTTSTNTALIKPSAVVFSGTYPTCSATITPEMNQSGTATAAIVVSDGTDSVTSPPMTLNVVAFDDAPVMAPLATQNVSLNQTATVSVHITDVDSLLSCSSALTATSSNNALVSASTGISFSGTAPNCIATVVPVFNQTGTTTITISLTDGNTITTSSFGMSVAFSYVPPTVNNFTASSFNEDTESFIILPYNNVQVDYASSCFIASTNNVTVSTPCSCDVAGVCSVGVKGTNNYTGLASFTYNVTANTVASNNATVSFSIQPVNDAPVISTIAAQTTNEDTVKVINFAISDVDSVLTCSGSVSKNSSDATIVANSGIVISGNAPNCIATITPVADHNGSTTITLTVSDGSLSSQSVFGLVVAAVNDAPVMGAIGAQSGNEDTLKTIDFTINDKDSTLSCMGNLIGSSSNTALVKNSSITFGGSYPDCTASVTPEANISGVTTLTFTVSDGSLTDSKTFNFTVNAVNDAPVISVIAAQSTQEDTVKTVNFTISDIDSTLTCSGSVSKSSTDAALIAPVSVVITGTIPNCVATITPSLDKTGSSDITLTVSDGSLSASSTFTIDVTPVNDAPRIGAIATQTTNEDTAKVVNFTLNDVDSTLTCSGSVLALSSDANLVNVSHIVFDGAYPDCTATITPEANQTGTVSLTFTANDGALTHSQVFNFVVNGVNDAPVINAVAAQSTNEDTAVVVNFTVSDIDSAITCAGNVSKLSNNTSLIPVNNIVITGTVPACVATITPGANQNGVAGITLIVSDGALSAQTSFDLTVAPVNDAPALGSIAAQSTNEDIVKNVNFTIFDIDSTVTCAGSMTASSSNSALVSASQIVFSGTYPDCTAAITPEANQSGVVNLTFTLSDGSLADAKVFSFTVNAVNDAPVITAIAAQTTNEDTPKNVSFSITDVDSVLACSSLNVTATSSNQALITNAGIVISGSAPACIATITPVLNQSGTSTITLSVTDSESTRQSAFAMTVMAVNDAPTIAFLNNTDVDEDSTKIISFTIGDVDSAITCSPASLSATSSTAAVLLDSDIVFGGTYPNCTATITPLHNQNGATNIIISVTDGQLITPSNVMILTVNPVNDAPTMSTIMAQSTLEDTVKVVNFTIDDIDSTLDCQANVMGTSADQTIVPNSGIVISGTGSSCVATITPAANKNGVVNLTLTVSDGQLSVGSVFALTISPVNDAPTIATIPGQVTNEDTALVVNFPINDIDSVLTCSGRVSGTSSDLSILPVSGIVITGTYPNCVATILPAANKHGAVNVTLTVTDGALSNSTMFALTVNAVDDAPVATNISSTLTEDVGSVITLTYADVENDQATMCSVSALTNVSVTQACACSSGVCTVGVMGLANYNGAASFGFSVVANSATSNIATATLSITAVNDAPTISSISAQTTNEDTAVAVNFTITDVDTILTCAGRVSGVASNTTLIPTSYIVITGTAPNCIATVTPGLNQNGATSITLTVTDGALTNASTFALTVNPIDDAPVASNISSVTIDEDVQSIVTLPYIDVDGDQATTCSLSSLSHITVTSACSCTLGVCSAGITGTANYFGTAGFSFNVTANGVTSNTATAAFTINAVNDAPTMAVIADKLVLEDGSLSVPFTIGDIDSALTCAGSVTATSSNTTILANNTMTISGTAPNCTATIVPGLNKNGVVNVTFTVSDSLLQAARTFALTIQPVLDISGSLTLSGVADPTYGRTLSFANITVDEAVTKAEVCISEDTNLDGSISAGEKCNTQTWLDVTSAIGASGSTTPGSWSRYTIKTGVGGASFTQPLAVTCSSNRIYFTHLRLTNSSSNKTEMASASWKFWNPSCLSGTVGLWLDASDTATVFADFDCGVQPTSGTVNGVKCWKDKSYNKLTLRETMTTFPKYMATGFSSSRPAVEFNGNQDIALLRNIAPTNIISAVKVNSHTNSEGNTLIGSPGSDVGVRLSGSGSWYSPTTTPAYWPVDFTYTGGASFVNGVTGSNYVLAAEHILYQARGANITWAGIGVGGSEGTLLNFDADRINASVGEIIMCTTDCSSSRARLEGYLAHKWGTVGSLPAGHAYELTPP